VSRNRGVEVFGLGKTAEEGVVEKEKEVVSVSVFERKQRLPSRSNRGLRKGPDVRGALYLIQKKKTVKFGRGGRVKSHRASNWAFEF